MGKYDLLKQKKRKGPAYNVNRSIKKVENVEFTELETNVEKSRIEERENAMDKGIYDGGKHPALYRT
jgi:hypothetical protein